MPYVFETLKQFRAEGYLLILSTCREDERTTKNYLMQAVEFCRRNGVEFDAVNESIEKYEFRDSKLRRKIFADVYIDDLGLLGIPEDWREIYKIVSPKKPIVLR